MKMLRTVRVSRIAIATVAVLTVVFGFGEARANLILNGSFETGAANIGQFSTLSSGDSTSIANWTVGGLGVDYIGTYWQASDGARSVNLSGTANPASGNAAGSISQSFATVIGQQYLVTFDLAGNPDGDHGVRNVLVSAAADSASYAFDSAPNSLASMGWLPQTFQFTATSTTTTLTFASQNDTSYGPAIDNVSVNAISEPASIAVFGIAMTGAFLGWRRREQGRI